MCLMISFLSFGFAYMFYSDGNMSYASFSAIIGLFFIGLMIRNILKTKKERENS